MPRRSDRHPKGLFAVSKLRIAAHVAVVAVALAGCQRNPLVIRRAICPAVAVPIYAGDLTLFQPGTGPDAGNIDVSATITNVRDTCTESPETLATNITYDVIARRSVTNGARRVTLPLMTANAIPGLANLWLTCTKDTALLAVVGFIELTKATSLAAGTTKAFLTFYLAAGVLYLTLSLLSGVVFSRIERWARKGQRQMDGGGM